MIEAMLCALLTEAAKLRSVGVHLGDHAQPRSSAMLDPLHACLLRGKEAWRRQRCAALWTGHIRTWSHLASDSWSAIARHVRSLGKHKRPLPAQDTE